MTKEKKFVSTPFAINKVTGELENKYQEAKEKERAKENKERNKPLGLKLQGKAFKFGKQRTDPTSLKPYSRYT